MSSTPPANSYLTPPQRHEPRIIATPWAFLLHRDVRSGVLHEDDGNEIVRVLDRHLQSRLGREACLDISLGVLSIGLGEKIMYPVLRVGHRLDPVHRLDHLFVVGWAIFLQRLQCPWRIKID